MWKRHIYELLFGKPEETEDHLEDLGVSGREI